MISLQTRQEGRESSVGGGEEGREGEGTPEGERTVLVPEFFSAYIILL